MEQPEESSNKERYMHGNKFVHNAVLYRAVEVTVENNCNGCHCLPYNSRACSEAPLCTGDFREDGRFVIWIRSVNPDDWNWASYKIAQVISQPLQGDENV